MVWFYLFFEKEGMDSWWKEAKSKHHREEDNFPPHSSGIVKLLIFFGGNQNFANANICKFWVLRDFTSNSALFGLMSYFMTPVYDLLFADSPPTSPLCYLATMLTPDVARSFWRPAHAIQCVGFRLQDNKNTTVIVKMLGKLLGWRAPSCEKPLLLEPFKRGYGPQ